MPGIRSEYNRIKKEETAGRYVAYGNTVRVAMPEEYPEYDDYGPAAPDIRAVPDIRRRTAPGYGPAEPGRRDAEPGRRHSMPEHRHSMPEHRHATPERRQTAPQRKAAAPQRKAAAPQRKKAVPAGEKAASTGKKAYEPIDRDRHKRLVERQRTMEAFKAAPRTETASLHMLPTFLMVIAVAVSLFVGYRYLCLKSSIETHIETIKDLETRLDVLRNNNDALERSIDSSVDLNYIYHVAVTELGMIHAGQDNIIQYDKTESEYVRQYEDIPAL